MDGYDWKALLDRIEQGMTTGADADVVRDLLDRVADMEAELAKFTDDDLFGDDGE